MTATEWDTGGVEPWAVRQSQMDESGRTVLTTEFDRDGTARFAFGAGAAGLFELTNASGELGLGLAAERPADGTGLKPEPGDRLALLTTGIGVVSETAAGAAGAASAIIVAGTTAFPSPTGADTVDNLGPDLRIVQSDSGRPPSIEYRDGNGWRPVDGAVSYGKDATTYVIDAGRLRSALGDEKVDQAVSALQERAHDTIVGERWTPDTGATRDFKQGDVEQTCRMYPSYKAAVEWAASSVDRQGLSPSRYGTAVHTAVDHYFKYNYPTFDPGTGTFNTEFSVKKDTKAAYYGEPSSKRFDAYEDVGNGTVCGYDIKVGSATLSSRRSSELRAAAINFYETNNRVSPMEVVIMQVKPWR